MRKLRSLRPRRFRREGHAQTSGWLFGDSPRASFSILPNLFTSASLFLSLFAIVQISERNLIEACWLILFAAVCDAIDGPVARLTRTTSDFGLQFDSLSDLVAFGVAPAFLMYTNLRNMDESLPAYAPRLALGASALYAICAAIRLARFNVQAETSEKRHFVGLPSPGAAGVVVSAFLLIEWLPTIPALANWNLLEPRWLHRLSLLLVVGIAILMISEVRFAKLRSILAFSVNPFKTLVGIIIVICLAITFTGLFPVFLFAGFMGYVAACLLIELRRWMRHGSLGQQT